MSKTMTAITFLNLSALLVLGQGYRRWKDGPPATASPTKAAPSAVVYGERTLTVDPVKLAIRDFRATDVTTHAIPVSSPSAPSTTPTGPAEHDSRCAHPWTRQENLWDNTLSPYGVRCKDCGASALFVWTPAPAASAPMSISPKQDSLSSAERGPARAG